MTLATRQIPMTNAPDADAADVRSTDVLILGGGISGLSLAHWLRRDNLDVHVLDRNAQPGGVIGTLRKNDFLFERGPNTVLDKYDSFDDLLAGAGLDGELLRVPLRTQTRHIWLNGRLHPVPMNPLAFLASPLLPVAGKLALLREPFVARRDDDETIADFVQRRLHASWVSNLVTPMVSGIWAGDPARLSIAHAFPIMKALERRGGSLVRGAWLRARDRRRGAPSADAPTTKARKHLVSFRDGLQRLPAALADRLADRYHGSVQVDAIAARADGGYEVRARGPAGALRWRARRLVIAAEADEAARWLAPLDAEAAAVLRAFPYNRLAVVGLGIRAGDARLPAGFGFLVPRGQGVRILGAIINSNFLPGRAPAGCAVLHVFIGGELDPAAADLAEDELLGLARRDLRRTVDWRGEPLALHIERWPRAIPQYDLRHSERMRQIAAAEARHPGLHLVGNWRGGVSIPDRVQYNRELAGRIVAAASAPAPARP